MCNEQPPSESVKLALSVLATQIQTHERYHAQKESMTWLISITYLGAAALLVGREPYWKSWSIPVFSIWFILLFMTACAAIVFLQFQFCDRHRASVFFLAANDVATSWVAQHPPDTQLVSIELDELDHMHVFAAV